MRKGKTIFLYGYYGCGNYGDDLLLQVAINAIDNAVPGSRVYVRSLNDVHVDQLNLKIKLTNIERILQKTGSGHSKRFISWVKYFFTLWWVVIRCDAIVLGGGTIFGDRLRNSMIILFSICLLARLRGSSIVGIGLGVAPLQKKFSKWLVRKIIKMSCAFHVRDEASLDRCQTAGCKDVSLGADLVFLSRSEHKKNLSNENQGRHIGIALLDPAKGWTDIGAKKELVNKMTHVTEKLLEQGWNITFIGFQMLQASAEYEQAIDDLNIFKEIRARIKPEYSEKIAAVSFSKSPDKETEIYQKINLVVGMRFHSLVLAAIQGKAFIGLAHDDKVRELCNEYNMPVHDLNFNEKMLLRDIEQKSSSVINSKTTKKMQSRAEHSYSCLVNCLGGEI